MSISEAAIQNHEEPLHLADLTPIQKTLFHNQRPLVAQENDIK